MEKQMINQRVYYVFQQPKSECNLIIENFHSEIEMLPLMHRTNNGNLFYRLLLFVLELIFVIINSSNTTTYETNDKLDIIIRIKTMSCERQISDLGLSNICIQEPLRVSKLMKQQITLHSIYITFTPITFFCLFLIQADRNIGIEKLINIYQ